LHGEPPAVQRMCHGGSIVVSRSWRSQTLGGRHPKDASWAILEA
jgi:hypothetical protein